MRAAGLPDGILKFFERGDGCHRSGMSTSALCRFSMCSARGPNILGHKHPRVTEAVQESQMAAGDLLDGPSERMVELAERLVRLITPCGLGAVLEEWTDATTTCVTLARAATGRRKILAAKGRLSRRRSMVHAASARRDGRGLVQI